jgi:hypothetical protein
MNVQKKSKKKGCTTAAFSGGMINSRLVIATNV